MAAKFVFSDSALSLFWEIAYDAHISISNTRQYKKISYMLKLTKIINS
jgi:hypothetical protein